MPRRRRSRPCSRREVGVGAVGGRSRCASGPLTVAEAHLSSTDSPTLRPLMLGRVLQREVERRVAPSAHALPAHPQPPAPSPSPLATRTQTPTRQEHAS